MKPRVFIGSSTEGLDIAYTLQENLEHDSNPTVWTQGIFELSSNSLDDLLNALKDFDFGIFIFKLDDIVQIRNEKLNIVRDNVIFELGLFIGRLGKQRVFFVLPHSATNLHLPTDLIGVTPGKYNDLREDKNLKAALGPFCNQVRTKLNKFVYESLIDLDCETDEIKNIALEKASYWEFILSAKLLKSRLIEINRSYLELEKGLVFMKSKTLNLSEFCDWISNISHDFEILLSIFKSVFEVELIKAYGEPGVAGNVYEIKYVVDKITSLCKELLAWEYDLQGIIAPQELKEVAELMKGWTKVMIDEINKFPLMIEESFLPENLEKEGPININLEFPSPPHMTRILELIEQARLNLRKGYN